MRVLLDTNVIVSAIFFGGLPNELFRRGLAGHFEIVTSRALLDELERILRERLAFPAEAASFVRGDLELAAEVVAPTSVEKVSRDPGDDVVLAAVKRADAAYLVTGDRDLLVLGRYGRTAIITPRQFADILAGP